MNPATIIPINLTTFTRILFGLKESIVSLSKSNEANPTVLHMAFLLYALPTHCEPEEVDYSEDPNENSASVTFNLDQSIGWLQGKHTAHIDDYYRLLKITYSSNSNFFRITNHYVGKTEPGSMSNTLYSTTSFQQNLSDVIAYMERLIHQVLFLGTLEYSLYWSAPLVTKDSWLTGIGNINREFAKTERSAKPLDFSGISIFRYFSYLSESLGGEEERIVLDACTPDWQTMPLKLEYSIVTDTFLPKEVVNIYLGDTVIGQGYDHAYHLMKTLYEIAEHLTAASKEKLNALGQF